MRNHKPFCYNYPNFKQSRKEDVAPDTRQSFAGAIAEDDYDDDNDDWYVEDFDLEHFEEEENHITGEKLCHRDSFLESPTRVLQLIRQQQDKLADFFLNLGYDSKGSPRKQIEMIRSQITKSRIKLADLNLRLDIAREIYGQQDL